VTRSAEGIDGDSSPLPQVLREYGFVADGERGALIGPHGDYAWLCAPRWESDPVFSSLIGGTSRYAVTPTGRHVWGGYYEAGSLIWRSRWVTESAIVECREALAFPGERNRVVVLRQIHALSGDARLHVHLEPAAEFGKQHMRRLHRDDDGRWLARVGSRHLRFSGAPDARVVDKRSLETEIVLRHGQTHDLVFELADGDLPPEPVNPAAAWSHTEAAWQRAVPDLGPTAAPRDTRHAYAVMRGLTGSSGAMVAAATMSLPERAEEGANYDYRYAWIRDQCYAGIAVAADGPHALLDNAVAFVSDRLLDDGPKLMPAYTSAGDPVPRQYSIDLSGYPGGYDIVGNHVRDQFQLDVFGEALLLFAAAARHGHLESRHVAAAQSAVSAIEHNMQRPDAGIWELRENHWAHSRLACAAGLRAAAECGFGGDVTKLTALADAIVADAARDCLHPSGRWQRAPDDDRIDARSVATYRAVADELSGDYYVYRYRPNRGQDSTDSAFVLCGFVMAMAALQQKEVVHAFRYFERNRAACGTPGIFAEEYDIRQRQMRGNLPQAFVHAAMFEASCRLADFENSTSRERRMP
jgi:hypothetical protein